MRRIFIVLLSVLGHVTANTVAIGNLAVVFHADGYKSTDKHPLKGQLHDLWCQAQKDGVIQEIATARFVRVHNRKVHEAHIEDDQKRAVLIFGNVPVTEAAKYRCEITTAEGDHVFGNMFAYSRPVVHDANHSLGVHRQEGHAENELAAQIPFYANLGEQVQLECPVVGYPHPQVVWYKDGMPIDHDEKYVMRKKLLTVKDIEESDAGVYRCKGYNSFPANFDGDVDDHEVSLDLTLKIAGTHGWIYPLIVILIILLLLFIVIYSCQAYKRFKADQYNVAKRERQLRLDEEKHLADEV